MTGKMQKTSQSAVGMYLYGITHGDGPSEYGSIGIDGANVYRVTAGKLQAVVSETARPRIRPERRNLGAHSEVLKRIMQDGPLLPMAFGIVATDEEALRAALIKSQSELLEQLDAVTGKLEMGLRLFWDVPNIFEYFISRHPTLREARDAMTEHEDRHQLIAVGQLFERLLQEEREQHTEVVTQVLTSHGVEYLRNPVRAERDVFNLACLSQQADRERFEQIVAEAAASFGAEFTFDYNGPWAPHHFVSLHLSL